MDELAKKIIDYFKFRHHPFKLEMSSVMLVTTTIGFERFEKAPIEIVRDGILRAKQHIESQIEEDLKYLDSLEEEQRR